MTQLRCPVCHNPLARTGNSLVCAERHTYDVARQGYVNLLRHSPENLYEDAALFAARRAVYTVGFFDGVADALHTALPEGVVLDAGCGEGSMLHRMLAGGGREGIGMDIAKPAVRMAAGSYKEATWCVADLCDIPLADASVDAVVNMLTPANYGEFHRLLRADGRLLKVVPNAGHLAEIRAVAGHAAYTHTLEASLEVFGRQFDVLSQQRVRYVVPCDTQLAAQVFTMTPMTVHDTPQGALPESVTVDVTLLVGGKRF